MGLNVYWAMAFILSKGIIREVEKRSHSFLWKGLSGRGYSKVSWQQVCRRIEEGGLGIRSIQAVNREMMSRHMWLSRTTVHLFGWIGSPLFHLGSPPYGRSMTVWAHGAGEWRFIFSVAGSLAFSWNSYSAVSTGTHNL
ncbi:UNVERIFIED_CONTAM: hypothetical protein Sradi_7095200 [Sesamum radiatum]|uniref:Uncharacterized protein n=1 Tax=Sesamum radiatum TaxID=300843 RepID=A0AAW2J2B1_SESRA